MSKSGTLKGLFKQKSTEKEKKELKRSATIHRDDPSSLRLHDPGPVSPGDGRTPPLDGVLSSPKEKKPKRFLSLRLKKKKRKDEGGDVFEELDSFSSRMSYDQMSVSTDIGPGSECDPHSDFSSLYNLDMNAPSSPMSPSKLKGERKGVFGRFTSFFQRRKSSSSQQQSNTSTNSSTPTSPVSPRFPVSHEEDGLKPRTGSHDASPGTELDDSLSQSSSPSVASLIVDGTDFPFADSGSSGRSSVREVRVSTVSGAGAQKNSGNVTPTSAELPSAACPNSDTDLGFAESVVEEVSKRLRVNLDNNIQNSSEENVVTPTTPMSVKSPLSLTLDTPKSPNLTSICLASKKTVVKVGEKGHSTVLKGITLSSQSSVSQSTSSQQEKNDPDAQRGRSEVRIPSSSLSEKTPDATQSPVPEREQTAERDSPVLLHKAIWVETYLGDETEEEEGEADVMTQEEEGFRVDSPPVLAIPVRVIPEDEVVTQKETPPAPSESLLSGGSLPESDITTAATSEEFQTFPQEPGEPNTSTIPEPESLGEIRSTRKTASLPTTKVFAQKVIIEPEASLEDNDVDLTTDTSRRAELKGLTNFQQGNETEIKDNKTEAPRTTTDEPSLFNTKYTTESIIKEETETPASGVTIAASDMSKPKLQDEDIGVKAQSSHIAAAKQGIKGAVDNLHASTGSGTKTSSSVAGLKMKTVPRKTTAGTKTEGSSDHPSLKERSTEKRVSALPVLKDQSGVSHTKPKTQKVSTSETDAKSPEASDKISEPDVFGLAVVSKLPKQTRPKEPVKSPTKSVRKPSFEETKNVRATSGNISPTKSVYRTGTKLNKEKSDEEYVDFVSGMELEQRTGKKVSHPDKDALQQNQQQSSSFLASKSKLPVSSPTRKTNISITPTSSHSFKKVLPGQTNSDKGEAVQKQTPEEQEVTPIDENETLMPQPESPKKGTGSMPPLKPSKPLSKRSMSHEENDTAGLSSSPTKQEKNVFARLTKPNENMRQHGKFPAKELTETSSSGSKLPTRNQKIAIKLKPKIQQLSSKYEDSNLNTVKDSIVNDKETVTTDTKKDSDCMSAEEHIKMAEKQTKTPQTTLEGDVKGGEIVSVQSEEIRTSKITGETQMDAHPVIIVDKEMSAKSRVAGGNNVETEERKLEAKEPKPENQKDNRHRQKPLSSFKTSTTVKAKDVSEELQSKTKLKFAKEKNSAVQVFDIKPAPKDGLTAYIQSAKPELDVGIHYGPSTETGQEGVMSTSETRKNIPAELVSDSQSLAVGSDVVSSPDYLEDPTKAINNRVSQTLTVEAAKGFDVGEKNKEEVGWKPAEALDAETETVAVCQLPKNVENQLNKEALLDESGSKEKDSRPDEMLNHTAAESSESQNSCKEKLKERPVDFAGRRIMSSGKAGHLSTEEKSLQPKGTKNQQAVVRHVLKGKRTKSEEAESAIVETAASMIDTKQQNLQETSQSDSMNIERPKPQNIEPLGKNEKEAKELITKSKKMKDDSRNLIGKNYDVVEEKPSLGISTTDSKMLETESEDGAKEKEEIVFKNQTMNKTTEQNAQTLTNSKTGEEGGNITKQGRNENHISDNGQKVAKTEEEKTKETQAVKLSLASTHVEENNVKPEVEISESFGNEIVRANSEDAKQKVQTTKTVLEKSTNNQQGQVIATGNHDGVSSESEHLKSEITDSSLQSLSNETETPGHISKYTNQRVQEVLTVGGQDGISSESEQLKSEKSSSMQSIVNETAAPDRSSEVSNKQVQKPITVGDHKGKSTESEFIKSEIRVSSLQSLTNEVTTGNHTEHIPIPGSEGDRDDSATKDTVTECLVNELETANIRNDPGGLQEFRPISATDEGADELKQDEDELGGSERSSNKSVKQPDIDAEVQDSNGTQDAHSVCSTTAVGDLVNETADVQKSNTGVMQENEIKISHQESKYFDINVKLRPEMLEDKASEETKETQIQEVKPTTTMGQSAKESKDKTTSKDQSNDSLVNESVNENVTSKLEVKKDTKSTISGDSNESLTTSDQEKLTGSASETLKKEVQEKKKQNYGMDATQHPDNPLSYNDRKLKTELQDLSSESLSNETVPLKDISEVVNTEVQRSKTTSEKGEDLPNLDQKSKDSNSVTTEVGSKETGMEHNIQDHSTEDPKDDCGAKVKEPLLVATEQTQKPSTTTEQNSGTPGQDKSAQSATNADLKEKLESVIPAESKTEIQELNARTEGVQIHDHSKEKTASINPSVDQAKNIEIHKADTQKEQSISTDKDGKVEIKSDIHSNVSDDTVSRDLQEKTPIVLGNTDNLTAAKEEQDANVTAVVQNIPNTSVCAVQKKASSIGSVQVSLRNDALKTDEVFEESIQKPESSAERFTAGRGLKQEAHEISKKATTQLFDFDKAKPPGKPVPPKLTPSAWLDVEDRHKKKKGRRRNEDETASDDDLLEPEEVDDFLSSVRGGGIPFSLPRKKHIRKKLQSPPFAMPAIREDRFERTFDPEQFQFGLRKTERRMDLSPAMVIKQKNANRNGSSTDSQESGTSADKLTTHKAEGQDEAKEETQVKEGKPERQNNEPGKMTSRLERMSILTDLLSSPRTSRKSRTETSSASNSTVPSNQQQDVGPQGVTALPLPVPPADNRGVKGADQSLISEGGIVAVSESPCSSSSVPPLSVLSEMDLPDHLEKQLKKDTPEPEASMDFTQTADLTPPAMEQLSITNISIVDAGPKNPPVLPSTTNYNHEISQNGLCTTKIKVVAFFLFH
uniref:Crystallin beta-gamma domain containing 1a n=1 Tax=Poecilia formosa TaxID=48698 RepID=A0A096LQV4_POEFO